MPGVITTRSWASSGKRSRAGGALIAEGWMHAAREIGRGAERFFDHVKGLSIGATMSGGTGPRSSASPPRPEAPAT